MDSRSYQNTPSRRHWLAHKCQQYGVTWLLERLPKRDCLIVLNYHRIGQPETAYGDPGIFSATPDAFAQQVEYLKQNFHVATLEEVVAYTKRQKRSAKSRILITFDDGYIDNYQYAYPILRSLNVQSTFFLTTSFVGTSQFPWWDAIAYMVKNTQASTLCLDYPYRAEFDLKQQKPIAALRSVLKMYKSPENTDPVRFLRRISEATGVTDVNCPERLFLDWNEAAEMVANGMAIGSHTHTHELLANLDIEHQKEELGRSKTILEAKLGVTIDTLAYPVGSKTSFCKATTMALHQLGYQAAFSFYGGVNLRGQTDPYDICRINVDIETSQSLFRLRTVTSALTGECRV